MSKPRHEHRLHELVRNVTQAQADAWAKRCDRSFAFCIELLGLSVERHGLDFCEAWAARLEERFQELDDAAWREYCAADDAFWAQQEHTMPSYQDWLRDQEPDRPIRVDSWAFDRHMELQRERLDGYR
jgi:hypothetical protein